ncbi:lactococcin 972 family bacteriocin [Gottfriedia acidiceleris]|uniref:Lactococcin 972 family bacteriocin n=1 Tax=Gottfriedia acidiceleris TaxID=371036 RepID=A0ABY4JNX9_9BACI|nr:lactococcin 972 family bacteriocin [Gottfriedia acidiceleris]UPM55545.1 lactococcin 972 family bacteriocin [Gottfriedia acidiceleris]
MRKKILTASLLALFACGSILPIVSKAAESWDYGYNKSTMQWFNHYYHSNSKHYGTITKNGITWFGPTANPGKWSYFYLDFNGPYATTYNKFIIK